MNAYIFPLIMSSVTFGIVPILDSKGLSTALDTFTDERYYYASRILVSGIFLAVLSILYAFFLGFKKGLKKKIELKTFMYLIATAFINAIGFFYYMDAIYKSPAININVIIGTGLTLFTSILLAYLFLNQPINLKMKLSLTLVIIGVLLTLYFSN